MLPMNIPNKIFLCNIFMKPQQRMCWCILLWVASAIVKQYITSFTAPLSDFVLRPIIH